MDTENIQGREKTLLSVYSGTTKPLLNDILNTTLLNPILENKDSVVTKNFDASRGYTASRGLELFRKFQNSYYRTDIQNEIFELMRKCKLNSPEQSVLMRYSNLLDEERNFFNGNFIEIGKFLTERELNIFESIKENVEQNIDLSFNVINKTYEEEYLSDEDDKFVLSIPKEIEIPKSQVEDEKHILIMPFSSDMSFLDEEFD